MTTAERHALAANLVHSGRSVAEAARELGVSRPTVHTACHRHGVPLPPRHNIGRRVRDVHESMFAPEWAGICLWRRATAEACRAVATWQSGQALACDEHREAMACNVSVRRVRLEEAMESWA